MSTAISSSSSEMTVCKLLGSREVASPSLSVGGGVVVVALVLANLIGASACAICFLFFDFVFAMAASIEVVDDGFMGCQRGGVVD